MTPSLPPSSIPPSSISSSPISSSPISPEVTSFDHVPVLAQELIAGLGLEPKGYYLDATVGGGGHSQLILDALPDVRVMAIDRDGDALTMMTTPTPPWA